MNLDILVDSHVKIHQLSVIT